jgi:hypothetical protein
MPDEKPSPPNEPKPVRRRWFQFSLRTMIVVTAIFCILLATWIIPSERQRRACKTLNGSGGVYLFENEKFNRYLNGPFEENSAARRWYGYYFNNVRKIFCYHTSEVDWGAFPHLQELIWMRDTTSTEPVTDKFLADLAKYNRQLEKLTLIEAMIQPESMSHFSSFNKLRSLDFRYTDLSNCSLDSVSSLKELSYLNLLGTKVRDRELVKLKDLPHLKNILLDMNPKSFDQLEILFSLKSLETVTVRLRSDAEPLPIPMAILREALKEYNKNHP